TTTVRVVEGVHRHTADRRADAHPAGAASFAGNLVHVVAVADLADGAEAGVVEAADLTGRHLDESPAAVAVGKNGLLAGGTGDLAAGSRDELDVVDGGSERDAAERHRVAGFGGDFLTSDDGGSH